MQLQKKSLGDVALLKVSGAVHFTDENTLKSALHRISSEGKRKVVVDCESMDSLNSHALSTFLKAYKALGEGQVVFANLNPHVRRVFETCNLDTVFPLYGTVDEALTALK